LHCLDCRVVTAIDALNGEFSFLGKPPKAAARHRAIRETDSGSLRKPDRGIVGNVGHAAALLAMTRVTSCFCATRIARLASALVNAAAVFGITANG
jgi:hypothetical protein